MHKVLATTILLLVHVLCFGQDNNYWNMQFGAKSSLLGGAVVGDYADNGTMFYNPGALIYKDSGSVNVSANLYKVERMRIENALGNEINTVSYNFDVTPQLISGSKKLSPHVDIGAVALTHNDVDLTFQQSSSGPKAIYPQDTLYKRSYIGDFDYRNRINEQWVGLCMSFHLTPKLSVGFTCFFAYRFQRFTHHISASAISDDPLLKKFTSHYDYSRDVRYDLVNTLSKFGLIYTPNSRLRIGLTTTMPSLTLFGLGKTYTKIYSANMASNNFESYTVFDRQKGLNAKYATPFSVAIGLTTQLGRAKIYVSAEYFAPIKQYDMINPEDSLNILKSGVEYNSSNLLSVQHSAHEVLNGAIGIEYKLLKKFSILTSYRTDFNSQKNKTTAQDNGSLATSYIDLHHVTLGCVVQKNKKSFMVGLSFSTGELFSQRQFADFNNPTDETNLLGASLNRAMYNYKSLGIIFGVTL